MMNSKNYANWTVYINGRAVHFSPNEEDALRIAQHFRNLGYSDVVYKYTPKCRELV